MIRPLAFVALSCLATDGVAQRAPAAHLVPENARPLPPDTIQPAPVEVAPSRPPTACEVACLESRLMCCRPCDEALTIAEGTDAAQEQHVRCIDPCIQAWGACVDGCDQQLE